MTRTTTRTTTTASVPAIALEKSAMRGLDITLTLNHVTQQDESDMFFKVEGDHIIVAYLVQDEDCEDPMGNHANGAIFTSHRHATSENHVGFQNALGLNSDWQPDFELVDEGKVYALVRADIESWATKDIGKFSDLLDAVVEDHEEGKPDTDQLAWVFDRLDDLDGIESSSYDFDMDAYRMAAWSEGRLNGTIGNKYAVSLDVYEHGGISYSLSGQGTQCQFDTARGGAIWVPDESCVENFEDKNLTYEENMKKAREYAKTIVEEYTRWCNGECYGAVVERHTLEGEFVEELDSCWGYIGADYAKEQCKEQFDNQGEEDATQG
jgi:hypothetical protein